MASVDIFIVANSALVDEHIYDLWLGGLNVNEACQQLLREGILSEMEGADEACVTSEVTDQFRFFGLIEKYLENPKRLKDQCYYQLPSDVIQLLIEKYYDLDDSVIREFLGKKLTAKFRKDLDDVSDKTKVSLKSCRRQFDNFRRVFKTVEDMKGHLITNIVQHYFLSDTLARKYAAAVFITNNRFETSKKRLAYLSFDDFVVCSNYMITHWSYSSVESRQDNMDVEVDREFLQNLKDLKALVEKEIIDDVRTELIRRIENQISHQCKSELESNFKSLYKVVVGFAVDLNHTRDFREFFLTIVEKLIEPCRNARWTRDDLDKVLYALNEVVRNHDSLRKIRRSLSVEVRQGGRHQHPPLALTWDRYYRVLSACILRMFRP